MGMDGAALLPLLKLAAAFGVVVLLLRLSVQVGPAMAAGAVVLGLLFSLAPWTLLRTLAASLVNPGAGTLAAIISLIFVLSNSMERLGQMESLLARSRRLVGGSRWGLLAFPTLIGLLPMPGGAYFSAPLLDAFDPAGRLPPALKSFLNYWYRHIWEYSWPLFPGVLLTCAIAGLELWLFILVASPMTLLAVAGGLPHFLAIPRNGVQAAGGGGDPPVEGLLRPLAPLILALTPGVIYGLGVEGTGPESILRHLPKETGLAAGLLAAVLWCWRDGGAGWTQIRVIVLDGKLVRLWASVAGVFLFRGVLEQSGAALAVGQVLARMEIPPWTVAVALPLVTGVVTGMTLPFVGIAFPVVVNLALAAALPVPVLPLMVLALVAGFTGSLLSPIHLCLLLSNEYFHASLPGVYRYLWLPCLILLGGGVAYYAALQGLGAATLP
jgi:hypothetical protein